MLIYAVADIHCRLDRIGAIQKNISLYGPDVTVIAGDIAGYLNPEPTVAALGRLQAPVFTVLGNHDLPRNDRLMAQAANITSLHLQQINLHKQPFVGVNGAVPVPFNSRIAIRERPLIKKLENLLTNDTVLVAHPPPMGILDEVLGKFHAGCRRLYDLILKCAPVLLLCGHIHERPGVVCVGKTTVVNCSMGWRGEGAIIEMGNNRSPTVRML